MNSALAFVLVCGLVGLLVKLDGRRAYVLSVLGAVIVAAFFYYFGGR